MKRIFLTLPFILILMFLYQATPIFAQAESCEYEEVSRPAVVNGKGCTIVLARGRDSSGKDWGCRLAPDNSKVYTRIKERTQCPGGESTTTTKQPPAQPAPATRVTSTTPNILPETEAAVRNYCSGRLVVNPISVTIGDAPQRECYEQVLRCVKENNLTFCLTGYNPPTVAPEQEAAPPAPQPEQPQEIARTVTEVWLQTAEGETMLKLQGGKVRFPINKVLPDVNEIRVKIVFDKEDEDGSRKFDRFFKVRRRPSPQPPLSACDPNGEIDPATWQNEGMDCSSSDPAQRGQKWTCQGTVKFAYGESCPSVGTAVDKEACWQMERNECIGCGISRTVERNSCETSNQFNQFRTKPGNEGQPNDLCIASFPTTFFRYECTGCREARRVDKYCDGSTFIAQEGIEGIEECADRCPPLPIAPCEKEDLAYYCEGDEVAVYKFRDTECQIQFTAVDCKDRGQVCSLGDCVNE